MKISELITRLAEARIKYGDHEVSLWESGESGEAVVTFEPRRCRKKACQPADSKRSHTHGGIFVVTADDSDYVSSLNAASVKYRKQLAAFNSMHSMREKSLQSYSPMFKYLNSKSRRSR